MDAEASLVSFRRPSVIELNCKSLTREKSAINQRAAYKYPKEYQIASQRYPAPVDY
jgi:hypothetical protein